MRARSAGRHYLRPSIVCDKVLSGLVCCSGRRMDLIPRAEHRVRRMRLSMKLAHLGGGGNFEKREGHSPREEQVGQFRMPPMPREPQQHAPARYTGVLYAGGLVLCILAALRVRDAQRATLAFATTTGLPGGARHRWEVLYVKAYKEAHSEADAALSSRDRNSTRQLG